MSKVSFNDYMDFLLEYIKDAYINETKTISNLRFGQAFINRFHETIADSLPDSELFYETDFAKADDLLAKYVDWEKR